MTRPLSPRPIALFFGGILACCLALIPAQPAQAAAARDQVEAFLVTTGFDVALDSIALSAGNAPAMLGMQADDFGADWTRIAAEVFDTEQMHATAVEILTQTLDEQDLALAVEFYASDLGQRLVEIENASHMEENREGKMTQGQEIFAGLVATNAPRVAILQRMNAAISSDESAVRAVEEIQVRFLMAAAAAGVIDLQLDEADLRAALEEGRDELRLELQVNGMAGAAYTYRDFSDDDLAAYAQALEHPQMRRVYELLNAVQHEIMASRFEALAARMADLHPGQEL